MKLKRLEIQGFKSFADKTEIVFEAGTTAIVGPNGSGKSNISDAVRWVLGEQSAKQLRGARMEDVIFSGTEKRKPLPWCEVSLLFDNEDRALSMDCAEVLVTRRVWRSGESEYYLNKAACRLKDITELFRDTGIGKEGYSMIGQGRIDEILSVRSEDRRSIFEEAAGIVTYRVRKEEAQRRMDNTRQNLERVEDLLGEMESQLGPLERQAEDAKKYLELRDQLKVLDLNAFVLQHDRLKSRISTCEEGIQAVDQELSAAQPKMEEMTGRREALGVLGAEAAEAENQANAAVLQAARALEAREGANNVLRERIAHADADAQREDELADQEAGQAQTLEKLCRKNSEEEHKRRLLLSAAQQALEALSARVSSVQSDVLRQEEALEDHKSEILRSMNRVSDMRSQSARLNALHQSLTSRLSDARMDLASLQEGKPEFSQAAAEAEDGLQKARNSLETLESQARVLDEQVRKESGENEKMLSRLRELTGKRHETASRLNVLGEMARDYEGYQQSVRQALVYSRGNQAVRGVVADLIKTPREYERALDMVLGTSLQQIVTEDEQTAKRLIEYLRTNRLGRATFLPMTTVRSRTLTREERQVLSIPGCIGVASELVSFKEEYRGIMENLLGRTVISKDLDAGIEIMRRGRHAFRLVTLEGDVMNPGGSMTGGSVQSRMTSLLSRSRELEEHRALLARLDADISGIQDRLAQADIHRSEMKKQRNALFDQAHQAEIAVAREQEHVNRAHAELEGYDARLAQAVQLVGQLEENLSDIQQQLLKVQEAHEGGELAQSGMQEKTHALQSALNTARSTLEMLREEETAARVQVATEEKELSALLHEHERLLKDSQQLTVQRADRDVQRRNRAQVLEEDRRQLLQGQEEHSRLEKTLDELRTHQAEIAARRRAQEEELHALSEALDELRREESQNNERRHRLDLQLVRLESELKGLQDRIWNDYELTYAGAAEWKQEDFDLKSAERDIASLRSEIRALGTVNVNAVEDYRILKDRHENLRSQRDDLLAAAADLEQIITELLTKMERKFRKQFSALNEYFGKTFTMLFGGGQAQLKLADEGDVLNCGIDIVAQPPGKKLQLLSLLSGGERALTAIAILFAMLQLKPTPFCILDEIEAALDEANVANFADYLNGFCDKTQFVVVTHRRGTMERCQALYGVAMEEKGVSRMVSVRLADALEASAPANAF